MKKIIFAFLASILLISCVSYEDKGETTVFQKVIEVDGMAADTLFDKALAWCKKEFRSIESNSNNSSIDYSDKKENLISATYIDSVSYLWKDFTQGVNRAKYTFTVETKDNRLRVTMQLLEVSMGSTMMYNAGATNWITAGQGHQEKAESAKLFDTLTDSLEKDIKGLTRSNDW